MEKDPKFKRAEISTKDVLSVRIPEHKKYIKAELQAMARLNSMSISQVVLFALDMFLAGVGSGDVDLRLRIPEK